ncbi:unnamed protein product, partial [Iphiclides podalirius]
MWGTRFCIRGVYAARRVAHGGDGARISPPSGPAEYEIIGKPRFVPDASDRGRPYAARKRPEKSDQREAGPAGRFLRGARPRAGKSTALGNIIRRPFFIVKADADSASGEKQYRIS